MNHPSKCVVLCPVAKSLEPETEAALQTLVAAGYPVKLLKSGSQVDLVRSALASQHLPDGYDETLWIDSDVVFTLADVERLRSHDLPFVAGLYVKKDRDEFACQFRPGPINFGKDGGLHEVHGCGMGFTLIRAEVFRKVKEVCGLPDCGGGYDPSFKITPWFIPMVTKNEATGEYTYLSEDYSFTERVKQAGYTIMADTTLKIGHVHRHVRTWDDIIQKPSYDALQLEAK